MIHGCEEAADLRVAWAVAERGTTATKRHIPPQRGQVRTSPAGSERRLGGEGRRDQQL